MKKVIGILAAVVAGVGLGWLVLPANAEAVQSSWHSRLACNTNATGHCTQVYKHPIGSVPVIQVTPEGLTAIVHTYQVNASTFRVRVMQTTSTPWANKSLTLAVSAFAVTRVQPSPTLPTFTVSPTTAPTATTTPDPDPTTPEPPAEGFPDAANTGVPTGITLTAFACTGDETSVTTDNTVIDSKVVNCDLVIKANNVVVKNSKVVGSVYTPDGATNYSFRIEDSELSHPEITNWGRTMVGEANFTVLRSEITGGNRGIYCRKNCTVQDSWIHGTRVTGTLHASAIRVSQDAKLIHNTIHCDVQDSGEAGCSANMTGYPDFEPVKNNTVERNLFKATPGGYCAYAGATGSKPYSTAADNATNIVFKDNVFEKGTASGKCGWWGPVTDFAAERSGNIWTNNKWDDGSVLNP